MREHDWQNVYDTTNSIVNVLSVLCSLISATVLYGDLFSSLLCFIQIFWHKWEEIARLWIIMEKCHLIFFESRQMANSQRVPSSDLRNYIHCREQASSHGLAWPSGAWKGLMKSIVKHQAKISKGLLCVISESVNACKTCPECKTHFLQELYSNSFWVWG